MSLFREYVDECAGIGLKLDSSQANCYLEKHDYANAWATMNRDVIAERFIENLSVSGKRLLDVSHNHVQLMTKDRVDAMGYSSIGESYAIHRKGASPTDEGIVMIPGSRGSLSYLVKPKTDISQLAQGGFSLAHGAGRKWNRSEVKGRLLNRYNQQQILQTRFGSRVICQNKNLAYEEAPQAYKNIDLVIQDLVNAEMIDIVASFKPLMTYKTRRTKQ